MDTHKSLKYKFRLPKDVPSIIKSILNDFPSLDGADLVIWELMTNAIEHGILDINFAQKSALIEQDKVNEEIDKRLQDPKYLKKYATVEIKSYEDEVVVFVCDNGKGFKWKDFLNKDISEIKGLHGRGIPISEKLCKTLTYIGNGNKVIAVFDHDQ